MNCNLLNLSRKLILLCCGLIMVQCTKEDPSSDEFQSIDLRIIQKEDLLGHWDISKMVSDTQTDLNGDKTFSNDLLSETDCFNTMFIQFNEDGTFVSNNATMTFEGGNGNAFSCLTPRLDEGFWYVSSDSLYISIEVAGGVYLHGKKLNMTGNNFGFDLTKLESDQYVKDPGNTQASSIQVLAVEYSKAE